MKKIVAAGVLLILFIALGLIWHNFDTVERETSLNRKKLMSITKLGQLTRINNIFPINQKTVFILYPYQDSVQNQYPQANRINQYLRSINYKGDEGYWSLVFVNEFVVTISTFKRSAGLDIWDRQLSDEDREGLPVNFKPDDWAQVEQAAFFKISKDGRQYLIFGRVY